MYYLDHYVVDWDKVQTLDDVKRLMKAWNITFERDCRTLGEVGDLVKLERKPPLGMIYD